MDIVEEAKVFPFPNQETRMLVGRLIAEIECLRRDIEHNKYLVDANSRMARQI